MMQQEDLNLEKLQWIKGLINDRDLFAIFSSSLKT